MENEKFSVENIESATPEDVVDMLVGITNRLYHIRGEQGEAFEESENGDKIGEAAKKTRQAMDLVSSVFEDSK